MQRASVLVSGSLSVDEIWFPATTRELHPFPLHCLCKLLPKQSLFDFVIVYFARWYSASHAFKLFLSWWLCHCVWRYQSIALIVYLCSKSLAYFTPMMPSSLFCSLQYSVPWFPRNRVCRYHFVLFVDPYTKSVEHIKLVMPSSLSYFQSIRSQNLNNAVLLVVVIPQVCSHCFLIDIFVSSRMFLAIMLVTLLPPRGRERA